MKRLKVNHRTVYRYRRPVSFGEHRLMLRPRDSHDFRYVDGSLTLSPPATLRWMHDVFGNSIAIAEFEGESNELRIESTVLVDHYVSDEVLPHYPIEDYARTLPFTYQPAEQPDLASSIARHYSDPSHKVDLWAKQFLNASGPTDTQQFLFDLTRAINAQFKYEVREEEGVQTPVETLARGAGSCRDFALLMMEAVRSLGLAARFVSGYIYDPVLDGVNGEKKGSGWPHAWVQVYLPGAGWLEFDPTNGIIGGSNLIRVAVARDPSQALPVTGTYSGSPEDFVDLTVNVTVHAMNVTL
ncbi:MAG: transglutaminase family protein [Alphaproteobacteria bacterium]|nr:MAG: transglutaminase family protein [Alphaproteobacteria bacterium]